MYILYDVEMWEITSPIPGVSVGNSGFPFTLENKADAGNFKEPVKTFKRPLCGIQRIISRIPAI